MKNHTGMEAHDGYVPHSHEVRADHRGVEGREKGSVIRFDGKEVITQCGHPFATCHTDRCFRSEGKASPRIRTNIRWDWETDASGNFELSRIVSYSKLEEDEVWRAYSDFERYPHKNAIHTFTPKELAKFLSGGMQALARGS